MGREGVISKSRVFRTSDDVVGGGPFALEEEIRLGDGVGLGVDLLAVEMGGDLLAVLAGDLRQRLLGHRQHAAGAAGAVVHQIGPGVDPVGDRQENELRHQHHGVARSPMLAGLLVVLLVEAADQLLEDRAHRVVVQAGMLDRPVAVQDREGTQVHIR